MPALPSPFGLPIGLLPSSASLSSPSPTTPTPALPFVARQNSNPTGTAVIIPTTYGGLDDSPSPGIVVAIVLGSVAGFLVLLFLVYSALGFGPAVLGDGWATRTVEVSAMEGSRSVLSFRSRTDHGKQHHRHSRRKGARATEMFEVRTRERVVEEVGPQEPPVIVEPTRQPPPSTFVPPPPRVVPDDAEDEVVVIEEHSPPPRRKSRRHSSRSRRSDERRRSYRDADSPREARRDSSRRYSSRDYSRER